MTHNDSADGGELRVGDRITVLPGQARSGHNYRPLTREFAVDVIHVRRVHDGSLDVEGVLLTARGAWRAGVPTWSVILPPGSYTTPIRVGDTVRYPETGETPAVTAIHLRPADGTALADLLFPTGATSSGVRLAELEHIARPQAAPTVQPCQRRHDPALACNRCAEAREPVTTGCEGPLCRQTASDLVVYWPERTVAQVRALCPTHRDAFTARNQGASIQVFPSRCSPAVPWCGSHSPTARSATWPTAAVLRWPPVTTAATPSTCTRPCAALGSRGATASTTRPAAAPSARNARASGSCTSRRSPSPNATGHAPPPPCTTTADLHPIADCPARRS